MFSASRYVMNGSPRCCTFCHEPLCDEAHRRGDRYFCNELCADACGEPVIRHPSAEDGTPYLTLVRDRAA
jgi:hypothetical protein